MRNNEQRTKSWKSYHMERFEIDKPFGSERVHSKWLFLCSFSPFQLIPNREKFNFMQSYKGNKRRMFRSFFVCVHFFVVIWLFRETYGLSLRSVYMLLNSAWHQKGYKAVKAFGTWLGVIIHWFAYESCFVATFFSPCHNASVICSVGIFYKSFSFRNGILLAATFRS